MKNPNQQMAENIADALLTTHNGDTIGTRMAIMQRRSLESELNLGGRNRDSMIETVREQLFKAPFKGVHCSMAADDGIILRIELRSGSTAEVSIVVNDGPAIPAPLERDEIRPPYLHELPEISAKLRSCDFKIEGGADE